MFIINKQRENTERYDANKEINLIIEKYFQASKENFLNNPSDYTVRSNVPIADPRREVNFDSNQIIPYATTTLGKSGCAIYTLHQGLRLQRGFKGLPLAFLADSIGKSGYYYEGRGTYHCLFDHYGLRRASDIQEVFDNLYIKDYPVVTVLVKNESYPGNNFQEGSHFVNAVGISDDGLYIDDPNSRSRMFFEFEDILPAIRIAWIW